MASDRTIAIRSLLLKAWRERWSDIQWGIHLKTVLPRGGTGDAYNLSGLILEQALVSPIPNALMLSFLRHSLAAQTISHGSLLEAISSYVDFGFLKARPHCITALLDLISLTKRLISKRSKPEECVVLTGSLMRILIWLLKFFFVVVEASSKGKTVINLCIFSTEILFMQFTGQTVQPALIENAKKTLEILTEMQQDEFIFNLLYVTKVEDKDSYSKMASICKQIDALMTSKTTSISADLKSVYVSDVILGK